MRLPVPATNALQLVDNVVAERQRGNNATFFNGIRAEWRERVGAYIDGCGSPAVVATWPAIESSKKSFLNLYLSPVEGAVQKVVLDVLRQHDLIICPSCGEPGRPNTLDHYLPKGEYAHFCITPHNLFPMCDACQREKGVKTGDADDPRFFLHPYFDVFVGDQVLDLTIHAPFDKPTFDLNPAPELEADQARLVARHVRELAIAERYTHFFRGQHRRLLRLVGCMRGSDQDVIESLEAFRVHAEEPSMNSWDHVFYSAVLTTPDFVDYLQQADLPEYL